MGYVLFFFMEVFRCCILFVRYDVKIMFWGERINVKERRLHAFLKRFLLLFVHAAYVGLVEDVHRLWRG